MNWGGAFNNGYQWSMPVSKWGEYEFKWWIKSGLSVESVCVQRIVTNTENRLIHGVRLNRVWVPHFIPFYGKCYEKTGQNSVRDTPNPCEYTKQSCALHQFLFSEVVTVVEIALLFGWPVHTNPGVTKFTKWDSVVTAM